MKIPLQQWSPTSSSGTGKGLFVTIGILVLLLLSGTQEVHAQSVVDSGLLGERFGHNIWQLVAMTAGLPITIEKLATKLETIAKENQLGALDLSQQAAFIDTMSEELAAVSTMIANPDMPLMQQWQTSMKIEALLRVYANTTLLPEIAEREIQEELVVINGLQVELTTEVDENRTASVMSKPIQEEMTEHILAVREQFLAAVDANRLTSATLEQIEQYLTTAEQDVLVIGNALEKHDMVTVSKFLLDGEYQTRRAELVLTLAAKN